MTTGLATDMDPRPALLADPADAVALQRTALLVAKAGNRAAALRLLLRAALLHRNQAVLDRQIDDILLPALNDALTRLHAGATDDAAAILDPLAQVLEPGGGFARVLATLRLVQGCDEEAARLGAILNREDSGLAVALAAVETRRADAFVGTVVLPVFNMASTIERALDSVLAAADYQRSRDPAARIHICVVDDASTDDSLARALGWARAHAGQSVAVIAANRNLGAGPARNLGAASARGRYLWFLDSDDVFLPPHLFLTARVLDAAPDAGFVRTGMLFDRIDATITPDWRDAAENSYPCNLCVRRDCHDFIGGFPEEAPFLPALAEDVAYSRALNSLFGGVKIAEKTVHYMMRENNALARQSAEMTGGPPSPERTRPNPRFLGMEILTLRRIEALKAKKVAMERDGRRGNEGVLPFLPHVMPPRAPSLAALIGKSKDCMQRGEPLRAFDLLHRAVALEPGAITAWFELGVAAHRLQRHVPALRAFRMVANLQPLAPAARFNVGSLLVEGGRYAEASGVLRDTLAFQPAYPNALRLLGWALQRLGRKVEAYGILARGLRLEPDNVSLNALFAEVALETGRSGEAVRHAQRSLALAPDLFDAQVVLAGALETQSAHRAPDVALPWWERAIRCNPGRADAFTGRTVNLLTRTFGSPAPRPAGPAGHRLASTLFGRHGRFGNQLLQYGVLRLYAGLHGLTLEVPAWPGRYLYGLDDPLPGAPLPLVPEADGEEAVVAALAGRNVPVLADRDVTGYFCGGTGFLSARRDAFRGFFTPAPYLRAYADGIATRLRASGGTVVALHLRRGDFGWGRFWIAPEAWYLRWLEGIWPGLDRPVLYVATDDPALLTAFAPYRPLCARDLAEPIRGAEFFTDFHALCVADQVAISNSSFSFTASMLNRTAKKFHRPDHDRQVLVPYDPWNSPVLL
ncbi:glycosyltransferase [Azospirillum picis]|uniref:Tetratricopeptide (TPR) repeat protein n=1 Tax=Azospirillum picis TaxID=488438 RepID=A0ABU0MSN0_9PROT|nr:glycosyltransferase [Azospirillum picis]MBP2302748.1 tetratricopeptide (TPR) repeat protein [Azospirillum picis]MDQ0536499.1 tetratricopeptide (TPR) repeat protein [Azospirillum picis]